MVAESPGDGGGDNVRADSFPSSSSLWTAQREFNMSVTMHQTDMVHLYSRLMAEVDELRAQLRDLQEEVHMLDLTTNKRKGGNNDY